MDFNPSSTSLPYLANPLRKWTILISCIKTEENESTVTLLYSIITNIASQIFNPNPNRDSCQWPELFDFFRLSLESNLDFLVNRALSVLMIMPPEQSHDSIVTICGDFLSTDLLRSISSPNVEIQSLAIETSYRLVRSFLVPGTSVTFRDMLERTLATTWEFLMIRDREDYAAEALDGLAIFWSEIIWLVPKLLELAEDDRIDPSIRFRAVYVLILLDGATEEERKKSLKLDLPHSYFERLFLVAFDLMVIGDTIDEDDVYKLGCFVLRYMVSSFGGTDLIHFAHSLLQQKETSYVSCRILIDMMMKIVVRSPEARDAFLEDPFVDSLLRLFQHPEPDVCVVAFDAILSLIKDWVPKMEVPFFSKILPSVIAVVKSDQEEPSVKDQAIMVIIIFIQKLSMKILPQYFDRLMRQLPHLQQVVSTWLSFLPIENNTSEGPAAQEQMCSLFEKSEKLLLGPDEENLSKVIELCAEVLSQANDRNATQVVDRTIRLLRRIGQICLRTSLDKICSSLSSQQQKSLRSINFPG